MIERVTVVKFSVNYGGGNGAGCFEVKVWADTAKFTDVIVTRLRKCSDLIRESKVFVENKNVHKYQNVCKLYLRHINTARKYRCKLLQILTVFSNIAVKGFI